MGRHGCYLLEDRPAPVALLLYVTTGEDVMQIMQ